MADPSFASQMNTINPALFNQYGAAGLAGMLPGAPGGSSPQQMMDYLGSKAWNTPQFATTYGQYGPGGNMQQRGRGPGGGGMMTGGQIPGGAVGRGMQRPAGQVQPRPNAGAVPGLGQNLGGGMPAGMAQLLQALGGGAGGGMAGGMPMQQPQQQQPLPQMNIQSLMQMLPQLLRQFQQGSAGLGGFGQVLARPYG